MLVPWVGMLAEQLAQPLGVQLEALLVGLLELGQVLLEQH